MAQSRADKAHADRVAKGEKDKADKAAKAEKTQKMPKSRQAEEPDSDRSRSSRGGPRASGHAAGSDDDDMAGAPAAPAAPVTLDSLAAQLTTQNDHMNGIMAAFAAQCGLQDTKFAVVDSSLARVHATLAALTARLDEQAAAMIVIQKERGGVPPASAAAASGSGPRAPAPSASSGGSRAPAPSPTTRSPTSSADFVWSKVFFDGCSHDIHRNVLGRYWHDQVRPLLADSLTADTRPFIGNRNSFSIGFPSLDAAKDFLANLVAKGGAPALIDLDGLSHTMAAHLERSKVPTKYGKRLSSLYQHYFDKLRTRPGWLTDFKLVADAHRGRVYIEQSERIILIHSYVSDTDSLRTHAVGLEDFGLVLAECQATAALFDVA